MLVSSHFSTIVWLSGVIHAAGILDRCFLPELSAERLQKVRDIRTMPTDAGESMGVLEDSHWDFWDQTAEILRWWDTQDFVEDPQKF